MDADLAEFLSALPPPIDFQRADVAEMRSFMKRHGHAIRTASRSTYTVEAKSDDTVLGPLGDIPIRVYRPHPGGNLPLVVYFHGGGFVLGDLDTHDSVCTALSANAGAVVVAADYRLAPENPFPAAVEDCEAVTRWALAHARDLYASGAVFVAGDSAGGNLAAVVAQALRGGGGLAGQVLIYPATDHPSVRYDSYVRFAAGREIGFDLPTYRRFADLYLGRTEASFDPRFAPLRQEKLDGICPALILTAELDPLKEEGAAYADKLAAAGVRVTVKCFPGVHHGFFSLHGIVQAADEALAFTSAWIAEEAARHA